MKGGKKVAANRTQVWYQNTTERSPQVQRPCSNVWSRGSSSDFTPPIRQSLEASRGGGLHARDDNSAAERQLVSLCHRPDPGAGPPGPANPVCLSQQRQPIRGAGGGGPLLP